MIIEKWSCIERLNITELLITVLERMWRKTNGNHYVFLLNYLFKFKQPLRLSNRDIVIISSFIGKLIYVLHNAQLTLNKKWLFAVFFFTFSTLPFRVFGPKCSEHFFTSNSLATTGCELHWTSDSNKKQETYSF